MTIPDLGSLEAEQSPNLIFRAIAGSRAYGTHRPESDTDIRGVLALPARAYLSMTEPPTQVSDARGDRVYYTLRRFLQLAASANPNIIELLYLPEDCVLLSRPAFDLIRARRGCFITKAAHESHVGYARAQIKKARGRKKWISRPQPKEPPTTVQHCWFLPARAPEGRYPYRPVPIEESGIDHRRCRCATVEHIPDLYRLYDYAGEESIGIIRGNLIRCSSIPREHERIRCIGLLFYHKEAHEQARRNHRGYWEWVEKRNPHRWQAQERGEIDYDTKNMMHTVRLILSGGHILRVGEPLVRFEGEQRAFLKEVLAGEHAYEDLIERVEALVTELDTLVAASDLPERVEPSLLEDLLNEATEIWERDHA